MEQNQTIGTLLQEYRRKKNVGIEEVAQKTKININILRALEEDDLGSLPNKTYVRGFVTNYAKTIGLDANEAKAALDNTYLIKFGHPNGDAIKQKALGALQADNPHEDESEEIKETVISIIQGFLNKKIIYAALALIFVSLIIKGVVNFFSELNFESQTIAEKTSDSDAPTKAIKPEQPILKKKEDDLFKLEATKRLAKEIHKENKKEAIKKVEEKKVEKEVATNKAEEKEQDTKENKEEKKLDKTPQLVDGKFPFKKFHATPKNMYDLDENAPEISDASLLPPTIKASIVENKQNVYIVAVGADTWISYKVDDEKIKRYVLKQGHRVLIRGDKILLFMGNFNASKVFLNNKLVTAKTSSGVKSLIFPEDIAGDYQLPLFPSYKGIPYSADYYQANMATQEETVSQ